ncbi:MAG: phosphoadenosine phosphosulfate reductase family protein [Eubacteriales bacterium]
MRTKAELRQMQSLPLEYKIEMTIQRIKGWYESWVRFTIENDNTGKQRFVTMRCKDYFDKPPLKDGEWISDQRDGQVYISFSGGKDSTVLMHIARQIYPEIEAVFVNTGLEYPEIQKFVKSFDNVTILRPKMRFDQVLKTYGYPIIGKEISMTIWYAKKGGKWAINNFYGIDKCGNVHEFKRGMYSKYKPLISADFSISDKCCIVMKERPIKLYEKKTQKKPIMALMASESKRRENAWLKTGCNAFDGDRPTSKPMAFWTEQDVLQYIKQYNVPIASVYGDVVYEKEPEQTRLEDFGVEGCGTERLCTTGCDRTGCIFCAFGAHLEKEPSRFQRLKETHPRQYEYCIGGGEYDENGIWKPNKQGLGMGHVFDEMNKIYGEGFIKY